MNACHWVGAGWMGEWVTGYGAGAERKWMTAIVMIKTKIRGGTKIDNNDLQ